MYAARGAAFKRELCVFSLSATLTGGRSSRTPSWRPKEESNSSSKCRAKACHPCRCPPSTEVPFYTHARSHTAKKSSAAVICLYVDLFSHKFWISFDINSHPLTLSLKPHAYQPEKLKPNTCLLQDACDQITYCISELLA